jgi:metallophosphoesterase (TIGR00282 family)
MKILFIGDICGKTGREALTQFLPELKAFYRPDWVIANGENVTGGSGISARHARFIKEAGVDIITTGNHIFARQDWPKVLENASDILKPHNLAGKNSPGCGYRIFKKKEEHLELAVVNLAGRVFMERGRCPFKTAEEILAALPNEVPVVVDFHAEATSEKLAMGWHLAGKVAAVVGTHTHVQTSDERILPGGTAVITDLGMTGARDGILGVNKDIIVGRFINGFSDKFLCGLGAKKIEGTFIEIDSRNKAQKIERFRKSD